MRTQKLSLASLGLALILSIAPGCSSSTTTTRTTTTYNTPPPSAETPQSSTTTTTTTSEPDSVLGSVAHAVGTIILLPFRIIGLIV